MADMNDVMRVLGRLEGQIENLASDQKEDRERTEEHLKDVARKIADVSGQTYAIRHRIDPIADTLKAHAKTLEEHAEELRDGKLFRTKWAAYSGIVVMAFSGILGVGGWLASVFIGEIKTWVGHFFK